MIIKIDPTELTLDSSKKLYTDKHGTTGITGLRVCKSAAGYYVGRMCDEGPYSRESGYYKERDHAKEEMYLRAWRG